MKNLFLLAIVFSISLFSLGQTLTTFTEADGLIDDNVLSLAVDENGDIWFGTQEGFSHFDGSSWTNYNQTCHPELIDNNINAIEFDNDGNLWLGTDFGISKWDFTDWTNYTEADGISSEQINDIVVDEVGAIWFATSDGVSILNGTTFVNIGMDDGLPFGGVNQIDFDNDGKANFCTGLGGVIIWDDEGNSEITEDDDLLNDKCSGIAFSGENNKWIATSQGVSVYTENNELITHHTALFELPEPDTLNPVEDVKIDQLGNVWASIYVDYLVTEGGVSMFDGTSWVQYEEDDGLAGPRVRRLIVDNDNDVWVATSTGVTRFSDIPVNISESIQTDEFKLYPNPASDNLFIIGSEGNINYLIYDLHGKIIDSNSQYSSSVINISNLSPGIYLFESEGHRTRFIKE